MNISLHLHKIVIPAAALMLMLVSSCIREDLVSRTDDNSGNDITVTMNMPGLSSVATYAMSDADENEISTVDVLVFEVNGMSETYLYSIEGYNIQDGTGATSGNIKTFRMALPITETRTLCLVVLANARAYLPATVITEGTTGKADVLKNILFTVENGVWPTGSDGTTFKPIPLWGESETFTGPKPSTGLKIGMLRALAKIDIIVAQGVTNFELTSVNVFNANTKGYVAPLAANYFSDNSKVTVPSIPFGTVSATDPVVFSGTNVVKDNTGIINRIYVAEAEKAGASEETGPAYLVIGGKYNDDAGETYYYVPFKKDKENLDLLRNYRYQVAITKVLGRGGASTDTPASYGMSMSVTLLMVDDSYSDINYIVYNDSYLLGVNTKDIFFDGYGHDDDAQELCVYTTTGNFKAKIIYDERDDDSSWLTINGSRETSGDGNTSESVKISVRTVNINTGAARLPAKIKVTADDLEQIITVNQDGDLPVQDFANCYIVNINDVVYIPLNKVYDIWKTAELNEAVEGVPKFELVWKDRTGSVVEKILWKQDLIEDGDGKKELIEVMAVFTGSVEGNALVAMKSADGVIRWSWHIWVVKDYDPAKTASLNYGFMDRNLGAITNTDNNVSSYGMHYQWGRKDPFPGSQALNNNTEWMPLYGHISDDEIHTSITLYDVEENKSLAKSINNPVIFYTSSNDHWYTGNNKFLWNIDKTDYDPCPPGWKVPAYEVLRTLYNVNGTSIARLYGHTFPNHGGYYPLAGMRDTKGGLSSAGKNGYYWSATYSSPSSVVADNLEINKGGVKNESNNQRGYGFSVRCIQE